MTVRVISRVTINMSREPTRLSLDALCSSPIQNISITIPMLDSTITVVCSTQSWGNMVGPRMMPAVR